MQFKCVIVLFGRRGLSVWHVAFLEDKWNHMESDSIKCQKDCLLPYNNIIKNIGILSKI